jgi:saccharopine dehydrogenase (NAD+, L-lysine-forming)
MPTLLIRAEDKNIWERRAPLIPADLEKIIAASGTRALVQSSEKRFFPAAAYTAAGAAVTADMADGDIILGIKEIPVDKLVDGKTYLFFSHTIKGQKDNMPMLRRLIEGGSTLIDYEKMVDASGRRLVYFGRYAGDAGAIDILWLLGDRWRRQGIETPFADIGQATGYVSVAEARDRIRAVGERIRAEGLPPQLAPLTIGVLGYGNVSVGAQQIFDCLPIERVAPDDLPALVRGGGNPNRVYLAVFEERHLVERGSDGGFELEEYFHDPVLYRSRFERYLPWLTIIVNAVYWDDRYPRFVTWEAMADLWRREAAPKPAGIADITCDVGGSVELTVKATDIGSPALSCDPLTRSVVDGWLGSGVVVLAVDNLPAELPQDASSFFSGQLAPLLPNLLAADFDRPLGESGLAPELERAVIVYRGALTPDYQYLQQHLA